MRNELRQAFDLLTPREKRRGAGVLVAVVVMAGVEVLGVGAIFPFLKVATDPSAIQTEPWLAWAYGALGFTSHRAFLLALGVGLLLVVVGGRVYAAFSSWLQLRWLWGVNHSISTRLLQRYLDQPYSFFLDRNTSELSKNVLQESERVVRGVFDPIMKTTAKGLVAVAIAGFLFWMEPLYTAITIGFLGLIYGGAYFLIRQRLEDLGAEHVQANEERFAAVSEGLGGIKIVKSRNEEASFATYFEGPSEDYNRALASSQMYKRLPSFLLEGLAFGLLVGIMLLMFARGRPMAEVVPVIGLFAFAGYRLMPSLQQVLKSISQFRYHDELRDLFHRELADDGHRVASSSDMSTDTSLQLEEDISLDDVWFRYEESDPWVLEGLDVRIPANTSVAFVGHTGAGKTTIIDLLLGLLTPDKGEIRIDGTELTPETLGAWQRNVGYVPQEIYLMDRTIAENIAFTLDEDEIDRRRIHEAAKVAHIHEYITSLENGYDTIVGERGVRLSGGQRQRIGIARAIYPDPDVLILDEATSDIDGITEANITRALEELAGEKTMIVVAHRLATIERCDKVALLDEGRVLASGTFEELRQKSTLFQEMLQEAGASGSVVQAER